jgi:hypothetical protein
MIINEEVMTNYLEQIVLLLNEILDVSIPFEERKCSRVKKWPLQKQITYEFFKSTLVINLAVCLVLIPFRVCLHSNTLFWQLVLLLA